MTEHRYKPGDKVIWTMPDGAEVEVEYIRPDSYSDGDLRPKVDLAEVALDVGLPAGMSKAYGNVLVPASSLRPAPAPEPTNLGCVIRDASGEVFVRINNTACYPWYSTEKCLSWDEIPQPVEILSEGWVE